jgi:hypothetical protein
MHGIEKGKTYFSEGVITGSGEVANSVLVGERPLETISVQVTGYSLEATITNAGFESGLTDWSAGYGFGTLIQETTAEFHSGTKSVELRWFASEAPDGLLNRTNVYPQLGVPYTVKYWAKKGGVNLCDNGDFETGNLTNWTAYTAGGNTVARDATGPHAGTYALKIVAADPTQDGYIQQSSRTLKKETSFTCKFWAKKGAAGAGGNLLSNPGFETNNAADPNPTYTSWTWNAHATSWTCYLGAGTGRGGTYPFRARNIFAGDYFDMTQTGVLVSGHSYTCKMWIYNLNGSSINIWVNTTGNIQNIPQTGDYAQYTWTFTATGADFKFGNAVLTDSAGVYLFDDLELTDDAGGDKVTTVSVNSSGQEITVTDTWTQYTKQFTTSHSAVGFTIGIGVTSDAGATLFLDDITVTQDNPNVKLIGPDGTTLRSPTTSWQQFTDTVTPSGNAIGFFIHGSSTDFGAIFVDDVTIVGTVESVKAPSAMTIKLLASLNGTDYSSVAMQTLTEADHGKPVVVSNKLVKAVKLYATSYTPGAGERLKFQILGS